MTDLVAHITPTEAPAGLMMFLAGAVLGALVTSLVRRFRAG